MKKILFLSIIILSTTFSWAQEEAPLTEADRLENEMVAAFNNADYPNAIKFGEKQLEVLKQQPENTDTIQATTMAVIGRAYYRLANPNKAIELNKEAIALYTKEHDEVCSDIANMYDNIAFYYLEEEQYQEAYTYSKKAVDIYFKLMTNDVNMAAALMHAAECANYTNNHADAVLLQKHACRLYESNYGAHSNRYLGELDYLIKYQKADGRTDDADETKELKERLEHEQKYGYIPMMADLSSAEKCRMHNVDAYYASKYFTHHYISADSMQFVGKYLFEYMVNSADVHSISGEAEEKWMSDKNAFVWLTAYFAGVITYQLENPEDDASYESYRSAVYTLAGVYQANKELTGEVPALEEYLKLYNKSREKLDKKIKKDFDAFEKARAKKGISKVEGVLKE